MYKQNTIERLTKGCIFPFPKEGDPPKSPKTTLTAKVYNVLLLSRIKTETEISKEKSERLSEKSILNITDSDSPSNHRKSSYKRFRGNTIVW